MRRSNESEYPSGTGVEGQFEGYAQDYEIEREDAKGKFITIVDATHFDAHYEYIFVTPQEEKRGDNKKKPPFHKMAIKLVTYEPNEKYGEVKGSWKHFMDVKDFINLCEIIKARPVPPPVKDENGREMAENKYGAEVFKSVGFSKNIGKEFTVSVMESTLNSGSTSYRIVFRQGEASENPNGPGFRFNGKPGTYYITLTENNMMRAFTSAYNHVESVRTAVNTKMYDKLYGKK